MELQEEHLVVKKLPIGWASTKLEIGQGKIRSRRNKSRKSRTEKRNTRKI